MGISCSIDVAEGAVAHLLHENESFQTRIFGHFACFFPLFSNNGVDFGVSTLDWHFLVPASSLGCGSSSLGSDIAVVVSRSDRIVILGSSLVMVLLDLTNHGLAYTMRLIFLLLSMDRRDIGGGLVSRWVDSSGLLAMTYEVLEVLYGTHRSVWVPGSAGEI